MIVVAVPTLVVVLGTVVIGIEDAGISLAPQQYQGIGQRLEPGIYRRFQRLQRLRVVVVHKGDGMGRSGLHDGSIQYTPKVIVSSQATGGIKIKVQWHIEDRYPATHVINIPEQCRQIVGPVL